MRAVFMCAVFVGCAGASAPATEDMGEGVQAEPGPPGPPGPEGPVGPPGADGPPGPVAYRWVDATGAVVTEGPDLIWIDPITSYVWRINSETGDYWSGSEYPLQHLYNDANCTQDEFVGVLQAPRVPFRLDGANSTYYVRGDWDSAGSVCYQSYDVVGVGCINVPVCIDAMALVVSALTNTGLSLPPVSGWVGPLHQEL